MVWEMVSGTFSFQGKERQDSVLGRPGKRYLSSPGKYLCSCTLVLVLRAQRLHEIEFSRLAGRVKFHRIMWKRPYSCRKATMGSRREAFRAGHMPKNKPMLTEAAKPMTTDQRGTAEYQFPPPFPPKSPDGGHYCGVVRFPRVSRRRGQ